MPGPLVSSAATSALMTTSLGEFPKQTLIAARARVKCGSCPSTSECVARAGSGRWRTMSMTEAVGGVTPIGDDRRIAVLDHDRAVREVHAEVVFGRIQHHPRMFLGVSPARGDRRDVKALVRARAADDRSRRVGLDARPALHVTPVLPGIRFRPAF